mgnify:CR=1 FL=1
MHWHGRTHNLFDNYTVAKVANVSDRVNLGLENAIAIGDQRGRIGAVTEFAQVKGIVRGMKQRTPTRRSSEHKSFRPKIRPRGGGRSTALMDQVQEQQTSGCRALNACSVDIFVNQNTNVIQHLLF